MENKICKAIKHMNRVEIEYNNGTKRIIEPYAYGLDKYGKEKLRAFQISGPSESGNSYTWKLFNCSKINSFNELDDSFQIRPEYNPNGDAHIPNIRCMI